MIKISKSEFDQLMFDFGQLSRGYDSWRPYHRELAQYLLPLQQHFEAPYAQGMVSPQGGAPRPNSAQNKRILDPTGTKAAMDCAAGMMNGAVSPARPWFNLRIAGFPKETKVPNAHERYLQEVRRRMLLVFAESNFYNAMAVHLLDYVVYGTAAMTIHEDWDEVLRFYTYPVGSYYLAQSARRMIDTFARRGVMTVKQLEEEFGAENLTAKTREKLEDTPGKSNLFHEVGIYHLIEPNRQDSRYVPGGYTYRETYWEATGNPDGQLLRRAGFREKPGSFPRWDVIGDSTYGISPGMYALPDVVQLQHQTMRKGEAIDKMVRPPLVIDQALRNQENPLRAGSRTYVSGYSNIGAKPVYQTNMSLGELRQDTLEVQERIRSAFFGDLFRMISSLDTVRSATEVDARREEKLVLLGPVLDRFENEALDPILTRVYRIMQRKKLFPDPPPGLEAEQIEVEYVSVLSDAQRAVGTSSMERFMEVVGRTASIDPGILDRVDFDGLIVEYGERLNVTPRGFRSDEDVAARKSQNEELNATREAALVGKDLTAAAKNLSDTDVGGGINAFQQLLAS